MIDFPNNKAPYFLIDVESLGLYGLGFSVAWVVVTPQGDPLDEGYLACPHQEAMCSLTNTEDLDWVETNVLPHLSDANCVDLPELYSRFWGAWSTWRHTGAKMFGDVIYPVETNFIRSCVLNDPDRMNQAPYPLMDVQSVAFARGLEEICWKQDGPPHNPMNDVKQSAYVLKMALAKGI